jgi:hypoxanthine phosphoribosyltransferase
VFLIRKSHERKKADIKPDFVGMECGDCYVYGVGMDLNGHFRNLSSIFALPEKVV